MKIIDNFTNDKWCDDFFNKLIYSHNFPWFYSPYTLADKNNKPLDNKSMFQHNFLIDNIKSKEFDILNVILNEIKSKIVYKKIIRIKSNLYINNNVQETHSKHIDIEGVDNFLTAIFYVNTTNGFTTIDNKIVKDKKNRFVYFDGRLPHFGTTQTDNKERLIINFNFLV